MLAKEAFDLGDGGAGGDGEVHRAVAADAEVEVLDGFALKLIREALTGLWERKRAQMLFGGGAGGLGGHGGLRWLDEVSVAQFLRIVKGDWCEKTRWWGTFFQSAAVCSYQIHKMRV